MIMARIVAGQAKWPVWSRITALLLILIRKRPLSMNAIYCRKPVFRFLTLLMLGSLLVPSRSKASKIKRSMIWLVGTLVISLLVCGCTKETPTIFKVGIICGPDFFLPVIDGLKAKMAELGFVEGKNIVYDLQAFNADPQGEKRAAERFVKDRVDLIVTTPTEPSLTAQAAIKGTDIPLVFAYASLEGNNLVQSVSTPGDNITGLRFSGPEECCRHLELMLEFVPTAKRVWICYNENYPTIEPSIAVLRGLAASRGVTLVEVPAETIDEIKADLLRRARSNNPGMDAILLMPEPFSHSPAGWSAIRNFADDHKIPIGGSFLFTVEQGALFGDANDLFRVGELTAPLAKKVLEGVPAGTIPVLTPEPILIINYNVAEKLQIAVPEGLLHMAARIIR